MSRGLGVLPRRGLPFLLGLPAMPDERDERDDQDARKLKMTNAFLRAVPHNQALGIRILDVNATEAVFELPYDRKLVGNPDTGTLHGGAITALLDGCSGVAVFAALTELVPIATLDLRIDYLKLAEPGKSVICKASCYKMTRNVAFTRAVAYQDDLDNVIAHSVGTFMLSTKQGKS